MVERIGAGCHRAYGRGAGMNRSSSLVFLGLLLVALAALFLLCHKIQFLLPGCQYCLELQHSLCPACWVIR